MLLQLTVNETLVSLKRVHNDSRQSLDKTTAAVELTVFDTIKSFNPVL